VKSSTLNVLSSASVHRARCLNVVREMSIAVVVWIHAVFSAFHDLVEKDSTGRIDPSNPAFVRSLVFSLLVLTPPVLLEEARIFVFAFPVRYELWGIPFGESVRSAESRIVECSFSRSTNDVLHS
jgi:hypothetical protein